MARPTLTDLVEAAARITQYSTDDIRGPRRVRPLARVRQAVIWLAWDRGTGPISLTEIGRRLSSRDHASICYSVRVAEEMIKRDLHFAMLVTEISAVAQRAVDARVRKVTEALDAAA